MKKFVWLILFFGVLFCFVSCDETKKITPSPSDLQPRLSSEKPGELYYYQIGDEDKKMIAKIVWKEARGEPYEGKVAVAATVFNRMNSDDPAIDNRSIYTVIHQRGAYASIDNVSDEQAATCMDAVEAACKGFDPTRRVFKNGARFFYNEAHTSYKELKKREGVKKMVIGHHTFHDDFA